MRIVINKGVDYGPVVKLMGHISLSFIPMAVPMACFFSTIYVMSKMSEKSELVAMRSLGHSKWRLMAAPLVLSLLIGAVVFTLNLQVIPHSKTHFRNTIILLTNRGLLADIRPGKFFTDIPGIILFAEGVRNGGDVLEKVFINMSKGEEEQVILAETGSLIKQRLDSVQIPSIRFHLSNGNITKTFSNKGDVEKVLFKEHDFPIFNGNNVPNLVTKHSMLSTKRLSKALDEYKEGITTYSNKRNLTAKEDKRLKELKLSLIKGRLEYWMRINTPIQCVLFMLLGFCLGIKKGRSHKGLSRDAINLLTLISYYAILFVAFGVAKGGNFPPLLVFIIPSGLAAMLFIRLFRRIDWIS